MSEVPYHSDEACAKWLNNVYKEKDDIVDYHIAHKTFPSPYQEIDFPRRPWPDVVMAMWAIILGLPIISLISYLIWIGSWYYLLGILGTSLVVNQIFFMIVKLTEIKHASTHGLNRGASKKTE
jgi:hypothetical protein